MKMFIDIETAPSSQQALEMRLKYGDKVFEENLNIAKVKPSIKAPTKTEINRFGKTALQGHSGHVWMIGWSLLDEELVPYTYMSVGGIRQTHMDPKEMKASETSVLKGFFDMLCEMDQSELVFVGHNVVDFDLRFMKQRAVMLGLSVPRCIHSALDTRYPGNCYDTMREWSGWRTMISLEDLCAGMGIDHEGFGDDFLKEFMLGDPRKIMKKNERDVKNLIEIYSRMQACRR